ncbi:hypothetical protein EV426DRAFT_415435 [Tirmania nivea]|nr:hypothetical protein EV426DRAFT_415435 [Tirmania nivea]
MLVVLAGVLVVFSGVAAIGGAIVWLPVSVVVSSEVCIPTVSAPADVAGSGGVICCSLREACANQTTLLLLSLLEVFGKSQSWCLCALTRSCSLTSELQSLSKFGQTLKVVQPLFCTSDIIGSHTYLINACNNILPAFFGDCSRNAGGGALSRLDILNSIRRNENLLPPCVARQIGVGVVGVDLRSLGICFHWLPWWCSGLLELAGS